MTCSNINKILNKLIVICKTLGKRDLLDRLNRWYVSYIRRAPYFSKRLYLDHLFGARCIVNVSYLLIYAVVFVAVLFLKGNLDKLLEDNYKGLAKLASLLEDKHPWDVLVVLLFNWILISRHCESMYIFASGKPIRMLIWSSLPTIAYFFLGIYILPLLLIPLPFSYYELMKPRSQPNIRKLLRSDIEKILRYDVHNLSDWNNIIQIKNLCQWDVMAVSHMIADYSSLTKELKDPTNGETLWNILLQRLQGIERDDDKMIIKNTERLTNLIRAVGYVHTSFPKL